MEFRASLKNIRMSPSKLEVMLRAIKGKTVQQAMDALHFSQKKSSRTVETVVRSALNNASQARGVNVDKLFVKMICVDKGFTRRWFMPRARGSSSRILKRHAHVTVVLDEL